MERYLETELGVMAGTLARTAEGLRGMFSMGYATLPQFQAFGVDRLKGAGHRAERRHA